MGANDDILVPRKRLKKPVLGVGFTRRIVFLKTRGHCFYCLSPLDELYELICDHHVPLSRGGLNDHSNLVPACRLCDQRKRNFMPTLSLARSLFDLRHGTENLMVVSRNWKYG